MWRNLGRAIASSRWLYHVMKTTAISPEALWAARLSFSQFGEDLVLDAIFKQSGIDSGFYVEVGAFDPYVYSNTYLFYQAGWSGLLIEPNPAPYRRLCALRPRDIVVNRAISTSSGTAPFVMDKACSGILGGDYLFGQKTDKEVIEVQCSPLAEVLDQHASGKVIRFLSVDCEGHDLAVLQSNDWSRFRPQIVIAEDHAANDDGPIHGFLRSCGYHHLGKTGLSLVFRDERFVAESR